MPENINPTTEKERRFVRREGQISYIEGQIGTLDLPWHLVPDETLARLYAYVEDVETKEGIESFRQRF